MERAARLFKNKKISGELLSEEDVARGAWAAAVGRKIAAHTGRIRLVRHTLVVDVEDAIWQRQLHSLSLQILSRLAKVMGPSSITDVEFRIAVKRRGAGWSDTREAAAPEPVRSVSGPLFRQDSEDEADRIADPILRRLYLISRKKATA